MVLGSLSSDTQLHVLARTKAAISSGREKFTIPHTIYASSSLTNRPDSGGGGYWALDTMVRQSSLTRLHDGSYEASIVDGGRFVTIFDNLTPNQGLHPGKTLGDDSVGQFSGHWGFVFTTTAAASASHMPKTVNGVGTVSSGNWFKLFFPPSTPGSDFSGGAVSSGPLDWSWSYSLKNNCGDTEKWVDADNNGGGQALTAGDITAPGPGSCI